ncbi:MAG: hypothetical protein ACJ790_17500 [Myxococcaceae bacterium]
MGSERCKMSAMAEKEHPDSVGFPSEWNRTAFPSYGPDWDAAIEYGIDVSLLLENLARTPTERLERLQQMVDFHEALRAANKSEP